MGTSKDKNKSTPSRKSLVDGNAENTKVEAVSDNAPKRKQAAPASPPVAPIPEPAQRVLKKVPLRNFLAFQKLRPDKQAAFRYHALNNLQGQQHTLPEWDRLFAAFQNTPLRICR